MSSPWTALRALDGVWIAFLEKLGARIERRDDCFVAWISDGPTLWVANEADLDDDDTIAQIILHELCHHWVEGPESFHEDDWGLNNMTDDDLANEYAALRLQAAVLCTPLQRRYLQPTTDHRWFYEKLQAQPLSEAVDPATDARSRALAQRGWNTWMNWPHRDELQGLLETSEACVSSFLAR